MPGKIFDLLAFAKEAASAIKSANGTVVSVSTSIGGVVGEVAWTSTYESLAQMEERTAKMMADAGYTALLKRADGLVVPGATRDQIWRTI